MTTKELFTRLLSLEAPFSISEVEYKDEVATPNTPSKLSKKSVHIHISVDTSIIHRPENSIIHDYEERTWRHLTLFQYPCYLHCSVPKYQNKITKRVSTYSTPWAKPGLGFTLLFEEFAIELVKLHGCVSEVAHQLSIYPQRLWRIIRDYGKELEAEQLAKMDMSKVRRIGYDETSRKKGHDYISCLIDLDTGELLYVIEGKSSETVVEFEKQAVSLGLDKEQITDISIDMSPAFIAGAEKVFPNARITFDKFHVSQLVQKAFDKIRKSFGRKEGGRINKWIFFNPYDKLKKEDQEQLDALLIKYPLLDLVYELKNDFKLLWQQEDKLEASAFLSFFADKMRSFKKKALTTLANSLDKHHSRIINVVETKITNAILEGFNSKIQTLKRKARGYKDVNNLILMVKLHCAKQPT